MLKIDKSIWEVCECDGSNNYRVVSLDTREVVARDISLDHATQIVDEHMIVRRIVQVIEDKENTSLSLRRSPL